MTTKTDNYVLPFEGGNDEKSEKCEKSGNASNNFKIKLS